MASTPRIAIGMPVEVVRRPGVFAPDGTLAIPTGTQGVAVARLSTFRWRVRFPSGEFSVASQALKCLPLVTQGGSHAA